MEKIKVELENCYGIRKMDADFDFSKTNAQLIYAPNGAMKSSFAKTFKDHSKGNDSRDRIYPERETKRLILDHESKNIPAKSIFVIEPYDSDYQSERVSTLLVNKDLKLEFDAILKSIQEKQDILIEAVKKTSGIKKDLEEILSVVISKKSDNLLRALGRIRSEVMDDQLDSALDNIKYGALFNNKVKGFLEDVDLKAALEEYTATYDNLLHKSRFFKKGVFNHYQAGEIAKQLKAHGFFKANHKVSLHSDTEETKVESEEQLEKLISEELKTILSDDSLKEKFNKIDKKLSNRELREFREFLLAHKTLIPRLQTPQILEEDLLKFYLMIHKDKFKDLMDEYANGKKRLDEISTEATNQATKWQDVIDIFNRRFSVPFKVKIDNKEDVILKRYTPNIGFTFQDDTAQPRTVSRDQLIEVLSNGERRALYILNIIFEVEARKSEKVDTIFIIDDIADSFDYKNKYAIIEYLSDILAESNFRQIILTHNYDFYRTVWNRLELHGAVFHISKTSDNIQLSSEKMYHDPFKKWIKTAKNIKGEATETHRIEAQLAMIPFVRNLANYCGFNDESTKLTKLLHIKHDSDSITLKNLFPIYKKILNGQDFSNNLSPNTVVTELLLKTAKKIATAGEITLDLRKKVVLSIAIRLIAEKKMIEIINDPEYLRTIKNNQTAKLLNKTKEVLENDESQALLIDLMCRVNLMTPENIHLNSFMYEPILDMSAEHLAALYNELTES